MTGVIWFVQIAHYPLFSRVGQPGFSEYEREHARRTSRVIAGSQRDSMRRPTCG